MGNEPRSNHTFYFDLRVIESSISRGRVFTSREGDYVFCFPGVAYCWSAEPDSTILTIRSPSGDSVEMQQVNA